MTSHVWLLALLSNEIKTSGIHPAFFITLITSALSEEFLRQRAFLSANFLTVL